MIKIINVIYNVDIYDTIYFDNEYNDESIIECLFSLHNVRYQIIFADK